MAGLYERIQALPRAGQWSLYAMIGFMLFLVWSEVLNPRAVDWANKADRIVANVEELRTYADGARNQREIRSVALAVGPVQPPRKQKQGRSAIQEKVMAVLQKYDASDDDFSVRGGAKLSNKMLTKNAGVQRIRRIEADVSFVATAENTTRIIAELESSPVIERITQVRLVRAGDRRALSVALDLECWVFDS